MKQRKTYGIKSAKRLVVMIIVLFLFTLTLSRIIFAEDVYFKKSFTEKVVIVEPYDTLWNLCKRYNNTNLEIRRYIHLVMEKNKMEDVIIYPGDRLIFLQCDDPKST